MPRAVHYSFVCGYRCNTGEGCLPVPNEIRSPVYMKDLYVYLLVEMLCCYIFVRSILIEIGLCWLVRWAVYCLSLLSLCNRSTEICLCLLLLASFLRVCVMSYFVIDRFRSAYTRYCLLVSLRACVMCFILYDIWCDVTIVSIVLSAFFVCYPFWSIIGLLTEYMYIFVHARVYNLCWHAY
jgi:hypothetical protein